MNATVALLMFCFVSLPQIVPQEVISEDVELGFFGELSRTIFFFGAHSNSSWGDSSFVYERPLAYLVTWCGVNVLSVLLIVVSMYMSYRRIKRAGDDGEGPYSSYSLIGWDHSVTSKEGGTMRSVAISTHLKEMMREEKATRRRSVYEKLRLYCIRVLFNAVSLCVLGGSAGLIYYVADLSIGPGAGVPEAFGDFLQKYQLTILVSGLKVIIPPILNVLLVLERYHPRTQIKLQIARTAVFYAASLIVFLGSVFSVASSCMDSPVNATQTGMSDYCCWENEVGEQLFQVVILDFIISLVFGLVFIAGRALVVKFCNATKLGYDDFDVPGLILDLVYGQSLLWLGLYSAPFLSAVGVVKQTVLFYFHYGLARACCVPPRRVFRASRSGTFFLFVLLVSLLACLVPMTYSILMIEPSESCGPFRQERWTYEVLTDRVGEASSWVQDGLRYASHPGLVVPLLLLLVLLVLYYRSKSSAHRQAAKDLRHHLQFERKVEKRRVFATARLAHGISQVGLVDAAGKNLA
ncbi:transmembrane channel-like protein 7 [Aplysia californica]|uniref:Transmembrane channel-like protein 7 n=1 Tax=Aplysia californica TaxID=6500 RepID=A0ABM0ZZA9_APLCA|nr:transmembrane channel-like protein 7 [Aplysia californica]